ncbi:hypothetical protein ACIG53_27710 [Streptomyces bauhiniae]|uniref:MmyB family transcriptional regulator n=1 Tax=Streptomyces bauhiniae TaxID=2340725 RepID=UPI0037D90A32
MRSWPCSPASASPTTPAWNRALGKRHPVRTCTSGTKHLHHPTAGPMDPTFETLTLPSPSGQRFITYTAEAGSASERALREPTQVAPRAYPVIPRSAER